MLWQTKPTRHKMNADRPRQARSGELVEPMPDQERFALFIDGANLYAVGQVARLRYRLQAAAAGVPGQGPADPRLLLHRAGGRSGIFVDPAAGRLARLQRLFGRHQADQGIRRLDRAAQSQRQHGHRAGGDGDGDGAAHRPDGAVFRRRRFPLAGRGGAAARGARRRSSRPSSPSRRWSPTSCAARPTNSSTSRSWRRASAAIRANARRAPANRVARPPTRRRRRRRQRAPQTRPGASERAEDSGHGSPIAAGARACL